MFRTDTTTATANQGRSRRIGLPHSVSEHGCLQIAGSRLKVECLQDRSRVKLSANESKRR